MSALCMFIGWIVCLHDTVNGKLHESGKVVKQLIVVFLGVFTCGKSVSKPNPKIWYSGDEDTLVTQSIKMWPSSCTCWKKKDLKWFSICSKYVFVCGCMHCVINLFICEVLCHATNCKCCKFHLATKLCTGIILLQHIVIAPSWDDVQQYWLYYNHACR